MSSLLLDSHVAVWWADEPERLEAPALRAIADPTNDVWFSSASAWELAIKVSIGKLTLSTPVGRYFAEHVSVNMFDALGIELTHIAAVEQLPQHHGDPFDRLLISQALTERLTIVSSDPVFAKYGLKRIW